MVDALDETMTDGHCYNFMPTTSGTGGAYRFSKKDLVNVYGWTNISGALNVISISNSTVLLGAFTLAAQFTAVAATAFTIFF